tara:strand:- start:36879 stop:38867 length:1989 start_codon:yes stop_codon:yes gene_type:complete
MAKAISPPPKRPPWLWANQKRIMPAGSPEPGKFNSDRAPWSKAITAAHASPHFDFVVGVMGSQMGKTESLFNICGHNFDDQPRPMLWVTPNRKLAESISKTRLRSMLFGVKSLWDGLLKGKAETITEKIINGVRLGFAWAGSATELASHSVYSALIDERDRMSNDIGGEGDPTELVKARVSNWIGGTVSSVSTPTTGRVETENVGGLEFWAVAEKDDVYSPIWKDFEQGSRHHWAWCCPHCDSYFIPRLDLLYIADDWAPKDAKKNAFLACPCCGGEIHEHHKPELNRTAIFISPFQTIDEVDPVAGGVWVIQEDDAPAEYERDENGRYWLAYHEMIPVDGMSTASFWVSGLTTNWKTFGDRAAALITARKKGDPGVIQSIVNTAFGELFNVSGDAPPWEAVKEKEGLYEINSIPAGVQFLTAGVDVQKDGFFAVIRGWGYNRESWLVSAEKIHGPTDQEATWQLLLEHLQHGRGGYPIKRVLVDSAYKAAAKNEAHRVYEWAAKLFPWVVPARGRKTMDKYYKLSPIEDKLVNPGQALQLCLINTDYFKSWVHSRINWPKGDPGDWHVYKGITDDYCKQVTAEARLVKQNGAFYWVKLRKDNHFFDCETLAAVAAEIEGVGHLAPLPDQVTSTQANQLPPPAAQSAPAPRRGRRVRSSGHS